MKIFVIKRVVDFLQFTGGEMLYSIATLLVVISFIQCKPVDHSDSEGKGVGTFAKKILKIGSTDEVLTGIKSLAKKPDNIDNLDNLKKLIAKGGKDADKAILAYRRGYNELFLEWTERIRETHRLFKKGQSLNVSVDFNIETAADSVVTRTNYFASVLENRFRQIKQITGDAEAIIAKLPDEGGLTPSIRSELERIEDQTSKLLSLPSNSGKRLNSSGGVSSKFIENDIGPDLSVTSFNFDNKKFEFINEFLIGDGGHFPTKLNLTMRNRPETAKVVKSVNRLTDVFKEEEQYLSLIRNTISTN